jgi:hypothetical protein
MDACLLTQDVYRNHVPSDVFACQIMKPFFEGMGIKYAPINVAADFAWELNIPEYPNGTKYRMTYTPLTPARNMPIVAKEMNLLPARTICECSIGPLGESIAPAFKGQCDKLLLIEPVPYFADAAEQAVGAKVIRVAIGMKPGRATMIDNGGSSFIKGTWSPTKSDNAEFDVDVVTFDTLDDGQIDIFNLDCEGQEWAVLSHMRSRPILLNIELWQGNPWMSEIKQWLLDNSYELRCSTGPEAETHLYVRQMGKDA